MFDKEMIYILEGKLWLFVFLEEYLTWPTYNPYRANQGSIWFHSLYFYILYLNIGDNVHLKCKGRVKRWYLTYALSLEFVLFDSRCVIKLWEILVSVILAPNLNFFTKFRSETLALASVSWIGDCMTSTKPHHSEKFSTQICEVRL